MMNCDDAGIIILLFIFYFSQSKVCGFSVNIVFANDLKFEHKVVFKQHARDRISEKMM